MNFQSNLDTQLLILNVLFVKKPFFQQKRGYI